MIQLINDFIKKNEIQANIKNLIIKEKKPYRYQVFYRPGKYMVQEKMDWLVRELRSTAHTCFDEIPEYQVMIGTREELSDKVIAVAWRDDGRIAGFCSTVILPVKGVGSVIHLGLTCVRPEDRNNGLTHILTHKSVGSYLIRHKPIIGKLWISNCAAVLSSLVNVAKHFEQVYPSPFKNVKITKEYKKIIEAIDRYYRNKIYIHKDAWFDTENYVFRGSVKNTVFQKSGNDSCYYHRDSHLNNYYKNLMNFSEGDEVLQIGFASTFSAIKHLYNQNVQKFFAKMKQKEEIEQRAS